jgi:hypothetical protein
MPNLLALVTILPPYEILDLKNQGWIPEIDLKVLNLPELHFL